ncbi:MAG: putative CRISPR-associated protein [Spirosomataceae bacterium]
MKQRKNVAFVSVGTSVLTNTLLALRQLPEHFSDSVINEQINLAVNRNTTLDGTQEQTGIDYILQKFCHGLQRDPQDNRKWLLTDTDTPNVYASAELQSTYHFFKEKKWLTDDPQEIIYLLCTDTYKCELAAKIVKAFLLQENIGHEVYIERIKGLDVSTNYQEGFENLFLRLNQLQSHLENQYGEKNLCIYFNFTGGYKGVIPKLQRYADVHGFRIFYQYEMQDTIVELNPINHELDILANTYIHLKEGKIKTGKLSVNHKKSVDELTKRGFFRFDPSKNRYNRTAEGQLAWESIRKVNQQITKLFGFNMEYYFFELLLNEPLYPDWTVVKRSVQFTSSVYGTKEIDLVTGTPENPELMVAEVKSFLQIYDFEKPASDLKKQLSAQLKIISHKNSFAHNYQTATYALFLYGNEDTDWHYLKSNLKAIKQLALAHSFVSFRVFCFGVPYNSGSKNDSPYKKFLTSKATFGPPNGRFLQVKELLIP